MRARGREVTRLWQAALDRPRWQQVVAFAVSLWALAWIVAQFVTPEEGPSALRVLGGLAERLGATGGWTDRLTAAWQNTWGGLAVFAGLLWAATTERRQLPALLGWVAVMLASERLGYRPAILVALATMVGFVVLLWVASLSGSRFVDRRPALLPRDMVRAGITAATLSAIVPLYAPAFFLARLSRPYVTQPPRLLRPGREDDGADR
ncbi:hypothetical protein [Saccharopolyspora rosea]|uniref:hypothetical protein n=1 Tax=Saccharopolyspora rosea TaxID=524884 RepID=UPI0021DB79A3|nr:hypothetical protein [Saccharopolyspora rosea]